MQIHIVGGYALYVLAQGVFGVEMTAVTDIRDGLVPLSFHMQSKTVGNAFSFPHSPTLELITGHDEAKIKVLCPSTALPVTQQGASLVYEVMRVTTSESRLAQSPAGTDDGTDMDWSPGTSEWDPETDNTDDEDVNASVAIIHRYRFQFDFDTPEESTLTHIQSTEGPIGPNNVFTNSYYTCEDKIAHFWASESWDGDTSLITLSPFEESVVNEVHTRSSLTSSVTISNLLLIPFQPSDTIREEMHRLGVCLPSGTVVIVWVTYIPTPRYWAKRYTFIR